MKTYLSKLLCLLIVISIYSCSNDQSEDIIEDTAIEAVQIDLEDDVTLDAKRRVITIYIQCPSSFGTCIPDLEVYMTVLSASQSINCPGFYSVRVYEDEYNAHFYGEIHEEGIGTVIRPPFGNSIPSKPPQPYNVEDCI
ncbi:hypothetical protein [Psychroserpens algicola]|uniref:Lipoprotein n=1 Tax=Psychroserpens algicola TaxID=1719034 RepID=A0ABT0H7Q8_9FLAO|nr:hypothetical protein [Psychroserpens algicola]MCK8480084.1 hypothetical protein [Psychroserpens algicola]